MSLPFSRSIALSLALMGAGCLRPEDARPSFEGSVSVSSQFNRRGMVENDRGVLQGAGTARVPFRYGGAFGLKAWANLDLTNETGDAWMPDGHAGEITAVDLAGSYSRTAGPVDLSGGVSSYVLPNGSEFLNGPRGTTTELFATAGGDVLPKSIFGFYPLMSLHYDVDEAEGFYLNGGVHKGFTLAGDLRLDLGVSLGYSSENHSRWTYGTAEEGFSDLRGTATLTYPLGEATIIAAGVAASTITDDDIRRWIETRAIVRRRPGALDPFERGIDTDTVWYTLGVTHEF